MNHAPGSILSTTCATLVLVLFMLPPIAGRADAQQAVDLLLDRQVDLALDAAHAQPSPCRSPESRQFDFWLGEWDVVNRQRRPEGTAWGVTGRATDRVYAVADGCGIVEQWRGSTAPRYVVGYSLRAWNPDKHKWDLVLLWPRPEQPRFVTLEGGFRHGRGEFFRSGTGGEGTPVEVRFTFSDITANSLRWNDGTSRDGGRTWATTWIMEFNRRKPLDDPLLIAPHQAGLRCTFSEIHQMDAWLGNWEGEAVMADGDTVPARAGAYEILDGCGRMDFLELGNGGSAVKVHRVRTFQPDLRRWVEYRLDNRTGIIARLEGSMHGTTGLLETPASADAPARRLRTRWIRLTPSEVEFETAVSTSAGAWTPLWKVTLKPEGR